METAKRPARRLLLVASATIAVASLACLVLILVLYTLSVTPWPGLFAVGLWGLPAAFLLALVLLGMHFAERRKA